MKVRLTPEQLKEIFSEYVTVRKISREDTKWDDPHWIDIASERYQWGFPKEVCVEAEPVEGPEWEKKFDKKIVVDTYGAKNFIRAEIITKLVDDIIESCCPDMGAEELVCEVRDRWLGGSR